MSAPPLLNLLGVEVHVSPGVPEVVPQTLALLYRRPALARPLRHRVQVNAREGRQPAGPEAFAVMTHSGPVTVTPPGAAHPGTLWIHAQDHDVRLQVGEAAQDSHVTVFGGHGPASAEGVMVAMTEILRAQGWLPLHASAFESSGVATLLMGPSGTGKSTTLLRALELGARPVAEDFTLLDPATLTLTGLDEGLRCLPDTFRTLMALYPDAPHSVVRGKHFVPWEALGEHHWQTTLVNLRWLQRAPQDPSGLQALGAARTAMCLWAATGLPLTATTRQWTTQVIEQLVRQLDAAQLNLGHTPVPAGALVADLPTLDA